MAAFFCNLLLCSLCPFRNTSPQFFIPNALLITYIRTSLFSVRKWTSLSFLIFQLRQAISKPHVKSCDKAIWLKQPQVYKLFTLRAKPNFYLSARAVQVQLINDAYNLVIDAIMGPEIDLKDVREPYSGILVTLKQVKIPIASVDVPSGIYFSLPSSRQHFSQNVYIIHF